MSGLEQFDKLLARAREESPPVVDVAPRVLSTIQAEPQMAVAIPPRPFWAIAGLSVVAASAAAVLAWNSWHMLHDPLFEMFEPVYTVMR